MFGLFKSKVNHYKLRKNGKLIGKAPENTIVQWIKGGKLDGRERVSPDGKTWARLDNDPLFRKYFY